VLTLLCLVIAVIVEKGPPITLRVFRVERNNIGNQRVVATTVIDAGPEPIWAFLAETNRFAEWVDATKNVRSIDPGPFGVDYVYKEYGGIHPFFAKSRWIVTTFVHCAHQIHMGDDGKVKMPLDIRLESLEEDAAADRLLLRKLGSPLRFVCNHAGL